MEQTLASPLYVIFNLTIKQNWRDPFGMEKGEGEPSAQIRYKRWPYIQVIERLIHKQLARYFYECITCSVNHNPVLKECTQPTVVTYFADEILTNMGKGLVTAGTVFIDLAKSFDTVDHEILAN